MSSGAAGGRRGSTVQKQQEPAKDEFQVTSRHSPWQNRQVRTWVVNCRSRNAAERSISGALTRAQPYDRIEVVGGEYYETVSLSFPVELVASEGERPVVVFRGAALQCAADTTAVVHGMTFMSKSKTRADYAVVVSQGSPEFIDCNISSMHITGSATPRVHDCDIAASANGVGLRLTENCGGTITGSRIHSHSDLCISADCVGSPVVKGCNIYQITDTIVISCEGFLSGGGSSGVIFEANSIYVEEQSATLQLTTSTGAKPSGGGVRSSTGETACVHVAYGATPTFIKNEVLRGTIGFIFELGGMPTLESNVIRSQRDCGIRVSLAQTIRDMSAEERKHYAYTESSRAITIAGNNVFDRCKIGIDVLGASDSFSRQHMSIAYSRRRALMEALDSLGDVDASSMHSSLSEDRTGVARNSSVDEFLENSRKLFGVNVTRSRFMHCAEAAIRYRRGAFGHIEDCDVENSGSHGVVVTHGSFPTVARCRFNGNGLSAIHVSHCADPLIISNRVKGHRRSGVVFSHAAMGIALDNVFTGNEGPSMTVEHGARSLILRNMFTANVGGGLAITNGACPRVRRNGFTHNGPFEVRVESTAQPLIEQNDFSLSDTAAILYTSCASGTASTNRIVDSRGAGVLIELDADPVVQGNTILRCNGDGIRVSNNGMGTIVRNAIRDSSGFNVHVLEGGDATIRDNDIIAGLLGGIGVSSEGCGVVEKNHFRDNSNGHIVVSGKFTNPLVCSNRCDAGPSVGILCQDGAAGVFRKNTCTNNARAGILCTSNAVPTFEENAVTGEHIGILCEEGGGGTFRSNRITRCLVAGAMIQGAAAPKFISNGFHDNRFAGVALGTGCSGVVLRNTITGNAVGVASRATVAVIAGTHTKLKRVEPSKSTVVEDNAIADNFVCGVLLESEATGRFVGNEIRGNARWGILGHVEYSVLVKSLNAAAEAAAEQAEREGSPSPPRRRLHEPDTAVTVAARVGGGSATFRSNNVHSHDAANIAVLHHPVQNEFVFEQNTLFGSVIGISIEGPSVVHRVHKNTVYDCGTGVFVAGAGRGRFTANDVSGSTFANVHLAQDCQPVFEEKNRFTNGKAFGAFVEGSARGSFAKCIFSGNAFAGVAAVHAVNGHRPTTSLNNNEIEDNDMFGVVIVPPTSAAGLNPYVSFSEHQANVGEFDRIDDVRKAARRDHGGLHLEHNTIARNSVAGVYVSAKFAVEERRGHRDPKVAALHPSSVQGSPTKRPSSGPASRQAAPKATPTPGAHPPVFTENVIESSRVGVVVDANSDPELIANEVRHNYFFGVVVRPFAAPTVRGNLLTRNAAVGLFCAQQSKGSFVDNRILDNNPSDDAARNVVTEASGSTSLKLATRASLGSFTLGVPDDDDSAEARRARLIINHGTMMAQRYEPLLETCFEAADFYGSSASLRLTTRQTSVEERGPEKAGTPDLTSPTVPPEDRPDVATGIKAGCVNVFGTGIWLEQGGEGVVEQNTVSGHSRTGILYSTLALLDSTVPESEDLVNVSAPMTRGHDHAHSSAQIMSAGGGCMVRRNKIVSNETDGVRVVSVVKVAQKAVQDDGEAAGSDTGSQGDGKSSTLPPPPKLSSTKKPSFVRVRRKSAVTLIEDAPAASGAAANAVASVSADHAEGEYPSAPSLESLTALEPPLNPPAAAALLNLVENEIASNGRFGVYVEQLFSVLPRPFHFLVDMKSLNFEQLSQHRLVLPPRLTGNSFARNTAAAVCVRLSSGMDGESGLPLATPFTPSAPGPRRSPTPTGYPRSERSGSAASSSTVGVTADIISGSGTFSPQHDIEALGASANLWYCAPQLSENKFDRGDVGVLVDQGANCVLTKNEFKRQEAGVVVRGALTSVVVGEGNVFALGTTGVRMENTRHSKIIRSVFETHTDAGVLIRFSARPVIVKSTFCSPPGSNMASPQRTDDPFGELSAPEAVGLCVRDAGTAPTLFGNTFSGMRLGAFVADFATPRAWRNRFVSCHVGLQLDRGAEGFWSHNLFKESTDMGAVMTHSNTHPVMHESVFEGCERAGLCARLGSGGRVDRCLMTECFNGLLIDDAGSHLRVKASVCRGNSHAGVAVRSSTITAHDPDGPQDVSAAPKVEDCFFEDNTDADVTIREHGCVQVIGCVFLGKCAVADGGTGLVEGNRFQGQVDRAIVAEPGGRATFRDNVVNNARVGLCALPQGEALFENNSVFNCEIGIDAEKGSKATFSETTLTALSDCAVKAAGSTIRGSHIAEVPVGIVMPEGISIISNNTIRKCTGEGILIMGGGVVEKNVVASCRVGIRVMGTIETPSVEENFVMDCLAEGVVLEKSARCTMVNNDIFDHGTCSLAIAELATCTVEANRVSSPNDRSAVDMHPEARCIMRNNTLRNQFSPAFRKMLASQRSKELIKYVNALAAKLTSLDVTTNEFVETATVLRRFAIDLRDRLNGEALTPPPRDLEGSGLALSMSGADLRGSFDRARTPSAPGTPRDPSEVPARRRALSSSSSLPSREPAPAAPRRAMSSVAKLTNAVARARSNSVGVSKTASRTKTKTQGGTGPSSTPRSSRIMVHRFNTARGPAGSLARDLGGNLQSAADAGEGATVISTTTRDPVASVLRTASCDAIFIALPPACELLGDEELSQLAAVDKFIKGRNLASLSLKAAKAGAGTDAKQGAKKPGIRCVCIVPKFFLSKDAKLFTQTPVAAFIRHHGPLLVDDGGTGFINDLVVTARKAHDDDYTGLARKYAVPDGFIPEAPAAARRKSGAKPTDGGQLAAPTSTKTEPDGA